MGTYDEARLAAVAYATTIAAYTARWSTEVFVGGGLTYRTWIDSVSDIDILCYSPVVLPEVADWIAVASGGAPVHQPRARATMYEFRQFVGADGVVRPNDSAGGVYDANVKLFPLARMRTMISSVPSLDEAYLEEIHSYGHFRAVTGPGHEMRELLRIERATRDDRIRALAERALELYGKVLSAAVRQRLLRDDMDGATMQAEFAMLGTESVRAIVCLSYLQSGRYPAPFKWRYHPDFLRLCRRGDEIYALLADWSRCENPFLVEVLLSLVHNLEQVISDFSREPWKRHLDDRWWWPAVDPVTASTITHGPHDSTQRRFAASEAPSETSGGGGGLSDLR